jgi:hypothetical protein
MKRRNGILHLRIPSSKDTANLSDNQAPETEKKHSIKVVSMLFYSQLDQNQKR